MPTPEQTHMLVLEDLVEYLSDRRDLASAGAIIHDDVILHMDDYTFRGLDAWRCWLRFIRSRAAVADLEIVCDRMHARAPDTIAAYGRWFAVVKGRPTVSPQAAATYRFREGKIAEIWTSRSNYEIIFGSKIRYRLGLLLVFAQLAVWCKVLDRRAPEQYAAPVIEASLDH